ncbi:MAG: FapA family protein [Pseudodesulfovibrio sp.]
MADGKATKKNPDAQFRFSMSEDGMKLGVSRYFPPNGGEGPSVDLLRRQVAAAGVQLPVDEEAAQQIVESIEKSGEVRRVVLVSGTPVQEPKHAALVGLGNLDFPVFPGDRFARKKEPLSAEDGKTIDGRVIKPKENFKPDDITVKMGENVELDPLTDSYVSLVWGMARLKDGTISVNPIPRISEDSIEVTGTIHFEDFRGQPLTPARIEKELRDVGVVIDPNHDLLEKKLRQAKKTGLPLFEQILVAGNHPVRGRDGWFEYLVSSREDTGTEDESGNLDFRDRGMYPLVTEGQTIGRLHAPTAGEGGIDIYGKTIPANGGNGLRIRLGKNVFVHKDEVTFESKAEGIMVMEKGMVDVLDCLILPGNVDLSTGNVKVESGSVKVIGSIQAGFKVTAPEHIIVGGSIESATVNAGGNVEVSGGILMPEGGIIKAGGDVIANYATNAQIEAGGDVDIANDITNCDVHADGKLFASRGKGHILGGEIITGKGMEVNEIGSELGVQTTVSVRIEHAEDEGLRQQRVKVKQAIRKIDEAMGSDSPNEILQRTKPEKRAAVAEILKHRITLVKRRKAISEQLNQMALKSQEDLAGVKIEVKRLIHPGTDLRFGGRAFPVAKQREASTIFWSEETREIVFE